MKIMRMRSERSEIEDMKKEANIINIRNPRLKDLKI